MEARTTSSTHKSRGEGDIGDVCWICLDSSGPLQQPCKCPRFVHSACLARWQLQKAGNREERCCRFCQAALPDWKRVLTPSCGSNAPAYMNVNFNGETFSFEVKPGSDGYSEFTKAIRQAFRLPDESELNITFTCDEPSSGSLVTLQGSGAYDAAVHCACVSAAKRLTTRPASASTSGSASPSAGSDTADRGPQSQRADSPYAYENASGGADFAAGAGPARRRSAVAVEGATAGHRMRAGERERGRAARHGGSAAIPSGRSDRPAAGAAVDASSEGRDPCGRPRGEGPVERGREESAGARAEGTERILDSRRQTYATAARRNRPAASAALPTAHLDPGPAMNPHKRSLAARVRSAFVDLFGAGPGGR